MKKSVLLIFGLLVLIILIDLGVFLNNPKVLGQITRGFNELNNLDLTGSGDNSGIKEEKIVTKIIDGDTVVVEGGESVRLLGIDCDEKGKMCYTPAKKRIEELLSGKTVILESGKEDRDQYERQLRYIFLDGRNINTQLVQEGFCVARFVGSENSKYKNEIQRAEQLAISNKIGCKWS